VPRRHRGGKQPLHLLTVRNCTRGPAGDGITVFFSVGLAGTEASLLDRLASCAPPSAT